MNRNFIILSLLIFTLIPFSSSANDFAFNRLYQDSQIIDGLNYSINVNTSDNWNTEIGTLSTVNATQFSNQAGVLNIIEGWVDSLWCRLTGCTMSGDIDMNGNNIENVSHVQFNVAGDGCVDEFCIEVSENGDQLQYTLPGGNVVNQIGFEVYLGGGRVRNAETFEIQNCRAVWLSGATGSIPEIKISGIENGFRIVQATIGLTTEDISSNQQGYVTTHGIVRDCNTSAFNDGDSLFLSTNGTFTNNPTLSTNGTFFIGVVNRAHQTEGEINVIQRDIPSLGDILLSNNNASGQDMDMDNGSIFNLWELVSTDGSRIATGTNPVYSAFSGLDSAEVFSNNQTVADGVITHALLSTDPGNEKVLSAWQSGKNNSGQYTRNSMGIFPDLGLTNVSILTNIRQMWLNFGIAPQLDYFSADNKTSIGILFGMETQQVHIHDDLLNGRLLGEGDFTWINRIGLFAKFLNGEGVLISKEVVKEFGFSAGDNITELDADFDSGTLLPFVQTTSGGIGDWLVVSNILCHSEECARALGGSGSPLRSMQANFSSIDQDNINLSWWLTTVQAPSDVFTVDVNNNQGSGDVNVFSSSSVFTDEFQSVILPASMNDRSIVTVKFNFQGNNINNDVVYVDEVLVVGNATTTTLANVTVEDGTLKFGDGTCGIGLSAEDGYQDLNITCDNINLIGNVTTIDITEVSINVTSNITIGDTIFVDNIRENTVGNGIKVWDNFSVSENATFDSDVIITGTLFGGSPVKVAGGLNVQGMITTDEINITSNDSIYLGWMKMSNAKPYTYLSGDLIIHNDDDHTTSLGAHSHQPLADGIAELVLEAGTHDWNTALNLIKNGPNSSVYPNYAAMINDGSYSTMVKHDDTISWGHYTNFTIDRTSGEIGNMTGIDMHMRMTNESLFLYDIDLNVNGSVNVSGIIYGDGSGLTNINKSYSSNWIQNGDNIYYNNGNVGIGINSTYTPTYPLEVQSQNRLSPALFIKPFEWDSTGDYATIHLGDVNNYIKSEYLQGVKIGSNWGTRIYQGTTERVHILSAYSRFFSPDGTPEITLNDGRLDLSGPLNVRDFWWGIDLSNAIGFRIQDGANKERLLIDGVKNKWISADSTNNLTLNNSGLTVIGDFDIVGDLGVSGNLTLIGSVTDDLTLDANQHFSVADSKIYSSDDNGYLQFGTSGDFVLYDVGNSATRLNINWLGTYVNSPTNIISAQITDSAFAVSYSGNENQIEVDLTDTLLRSPNGVNKFNLNNTGAFVTGDLDVSGNTVISGSLNVTDQTTSSPGFENEIAGSLIVGTAGNVTSANYEYLKLSRWAGDFGGTGLILEGPGNGAGGYYSDFHIDNFWGYMRIFTDAATTKNIIISNVGAGDMRLGINSGNPTHSLDVNGSAIIRGSLNVTTGFTGSCVNVTYSGGVAVSCNDA